MSCSWTNRMAVGAVLALLAAVGVGCAQDVGDIDRTQPDKIEKEIFTDNDQWYMAQTVVDTNEQGSSASGALFIARESPLKRIRWEITKNYLYAYSTVDPVEGLSDDTRSDDDKQLGVVAAYPIRSHFDVQRQYNPRTGEPSNVIVENRSDRPWYEREYMRVAWDQAAGAGFGLLTKGLIGARGTLRHYQRQEDAEVHADRTRIDDEYIDTTTQFTFQPDLMSCFQNLGIDAVRYCEGGRVKVRSSFLRITEDMKEDEYEPMEYTDTRELHRNGSDENRPLMTTSVYDQSTQYYMDVQCNRETAQFLEQRYGSTTEQCTEARFDFFSRFGFFRTTRTEFDKRRPQTDPLRKYYVQRWDIWRNSPSELPDDAQCLSTGEQCDRNAWDKAKNRRNPQPVVYHLNPGYPRDMISAAEEVESQWNEALLESADLKIREWKNRGSEFSDFEMTTAKFNEVADQLNLGAQTKNRLSNVANVVETDDQQEADQINSNFEQGRFVSLVEELRQKDLLKWIGTEDDADDAVAQLDAVGLANQKPMAAFKKQETGQMYRIKKNACHPGPFVRWFKEHGVKKRGDVRAPDRIVADSLGSDPTSMSEGRLEETLWGLPVEERIEMCAEVEHATEQRPENEAPFTFERQGDLRYSFFNWVREYNGFWSGYGPSAADPLTGEIISADANFAGTPLRSTASYAADIIQYMNGELDNQSVRYGTHIQQYLNQVRDRQGDKQQQAIGPDKLPDDFEEELDRRRQEASRSDFSGVDSPNFSEQERLKKMGAEKFERKVRQISKSVSRTKSSDARFAQFYENPQVKQMMKRDPQFQTMVDALSKAMYGPDADDDAKHQAYLNLTTPNLLQQRQQQSQRWMSSKNIFSKKNLRRAVEGLITYRGAAKRFEGMDRTEIRDYFEKNAFIGTQLHEVGHTMGLRHNFSASLDALNWHDAYWNIQKKLLTDERVVRTLPENSGEDSNKQSVYSLTGELADEVVPGEEDVDYASEEEFQLASIMDYTADLTGRFAGLGKYDQAAMNFVYGGHVQVWKDDVDIPNLFWYQKRVGDYSELPRILGETKDGSEDKSTVQKKLDGIEIIKNGREYIPIEKAMERRRKGITRSTQQWQGGDLGPNTEPYIDKTVDYNFCSDDRAGYALGCDTFDHGGNQTEVVNHAFNKYRFFQPFWRYKGQSIDKGNQFVRSYIGRVQQTLRTGQRPFRYYSIYEWLGIDMGAYTEDLQRASIDSLNFFAEVVATPEPGRYCDTANSVDKNWFYDTSNSFVPADWNSQNGRCSNYVEIPRGVGQYYGNELTDQYTTRLRRIGTYYDKLLATRTFFYISGNWVNSALITDSRATDISFWSLFKDEMLNWIGSIIIGDYTGFAGRYDPGSGEYYPPQVVEPNDFGQETTEGSTEAVGENLKRVRARAGWNQQLNTLAGAMLTNSSWRDQTVDFDQYIKVIKNEDDKQDIDSNMHQFEHPQTHVTYKAPETSDGESISVDLINWAEELKTDWQLAHCLEKTYDPTVDNPTDHLLAECADNRETLPVQIQTGSEDAIASTEQSLEDFERTRHRQMEDVVAKLTMIREINTLVGNVTTGAGN